MMKIVNTKIAQTAVEYSVLIACIVTALVVMSTYGRRAVAGALQRAANTISEKHFAPQKDNWSVTVYGDSERTTESWMVKDVGEDGDTVGWQMYTEDTIEKDETGKHGRE